jgi:hypothetical protein
MIKVVEVVSYPNRPVVGIQLDNETGVLHVRILHLYCSYQNNNRTSRLIIYHFIK